MDMIRCLYVSFNSSTLQIFFVPGSCRYVILEICVRSPVPVAGWRLFFLDASWNPSPVFTAA